MMVGRQFGWLWTAYAVSLAGTWLAFDAFPLIAIRVLHASALQVSLLAATGLAVGAVAAIPLGPWVEGRRKRPVMIALDLLRCSALMTVPAAFLLGQLGFWQLLAVSVLVATADIGFNAASGAFLKGLLPKADLLAANGRFEATTWTATMLGPPLGGLAIGLLGPATTVVANAASFVLSAIALLAIGGGEPVPEAKPGLRRGELLEGWRTILGHATLRRLFFNTVLVNGLIMATAPLLAVLMLGPLGFTPWQYGLAFAAPCAGGLVGSRLAGRLVTRFGQARVIRVAGVLRACWPVGLAFIGPGWAGLALVVGVELGLITCAAVFNPVFAAYRLEETPADRVARTLTAWSISSKLAIAGLTALWGLLAGWLGAREAIALAGVLLLATPLLLPRSAEAQREGAAEHGERQQQA